MGIYWRAAARSMHHCWLLKPELFTTVERWVGVETQGKYTRGMTVVDYYFLSGNKPNATVMVDVDRQGLSIC